jgi:hypothetical protein
MQRLMMMQIGGRERGAGLMKGTSQRFPFTGNSNPDWAYS